MKPEAILVMFLGLGALFILLIDDWWKRRLVAKANRSGKKVRDDLRANKTPWGLVVALAVGLGLYALLLSHPEWTDRDFGPLTPMVQWLFAKPN